ncbi:MAG: DUF177 domain-containing protein [Solobacterium sp.]|nr:DUF177 domain-containing protein [Solobacterium sp.]
MKWTRSELLRQSQKVTFDEEVEIDASAFEGNSRINAVKDVRVDGSGWLDDADGRFYAEINVSGIMLCPDAIIGEEIEVPFETDSDEVYVFEDTDEDGARIVKDEVIELLPAVIDDILLEVPLQVTEAAEGEYPEGKDWKVYSEAEYQEMLKERIDPRLEILKDFDSKR